MGPANKKSDKIPMPMSIVKTKLTEALFRACSAFVSSLFAIVVAALSDSDSARASMGVSCVARDNAVESIHSARTNGKQNLTRARAFLS